MSKFVGCFVLLANLWAFTAAAQSQPPPEMQSLSRTFEGRWSIAEKYEPDEWTPNGGVGHGEEIWRRGPGGFTLMEEVRDYGPIGESFGLALSWWDKDNGLQGIWCAGENPKGCDLNPKPVLKWDGKQFVFDAEFPRGGKTLAWHEAFSDITPTSFVQTADIGEKGGPLKRWLTIRATRVQEKPVQDSVSDSTETQGTTETKLVALTNEWTEAINRKDRKKLDELMSLDYALYAWNGKMLASRPVWLDNLFSHIKIENNTLTGLAPRAYGDFAVITSKGDWIGFFDGQHFNQKCIVVDTWRMINGRWEVVTRTSDCADQ